MKILIPILLSLYCINPVYSQSSISGVVYNDTNGNEAYDVGEGINNVKVWLFDLNAVAPYYRVVPIQEVYTDVSGNYLFSNIAAGNYQVRVGVSTLPPALCRAVQDNDSYPNGLTEMFGIDGVSTYNNVNFGFAANAATPGFTSTGIFKWNSANMFTGGQATNTFSLPPETINSTTFYPTISWKTSRSCTPGGGFGSDTFPLAGTGTTQPVDWPGNLKGGINTNDTTFQIMMGGSCYNGADSDKQVTTISFNYPVKNVAFSIYDIDHAYPQRASGRIDHVKITGSYNGSAVMPVIINPSAAPWNTISGNNICGFIDYPLTMYTLAYNSQNEDHGTVNVYFQSDVTSITIEYEEWAPLLLEGKGITDATPPASAPAESDWSDRVPTTRGTAIGSISYTLDSSLATLPVVLSSFNVAAKKCTPALSWNIENVQNLKQFIVERSTDGNTFTFVDIISFQDNVYKYSFLDTWADNGNYYYRLKMKDIFGQIQISGVISCSINCAGNKSILISPNPVTGNSGKVVMKGYPKGTYKVDLFSPHGQRIISGFIGVSASGFGKYEIDVKKSSGVYFLQILDPSGNLLHTEKLLIQ